MTNKLVCSGVQNLHCSQHECLHHKEHEQHETCEQMFCSLKHTSCYCYEPITEPTKPTKKKKLAKLPKFDTWLKEEETSSNKQSFAERLAQLLQKR